MDTKTLDTLNLRFTGPELAELIKMIGGQAFFGLEIEQGTGVEKIQVDATSEAIRQSLLARGALTRVADDRLTVDRYIERLLKLCLYPEYRVVLLGRRGVAAVPQYEAYYQTQNLTIRQLEVLPSVFDLTVFKTRPDFESAVFSYCVCETAYDSEMFCLTYASFRMIERALATENASDALAMLTDLDIEVPKARTIHDILTGYDMKLYLELADFAHAIVTCSDFRIW